MKHFILFAWTLIASGWPIAAQQVKAAQVKKSHPADIRIDHDIRVENQSLEYIFFDLLLNTGFHGGVAEIAGCSELPEGHLEIKQSVTLRQAMDALVADNPGYRWEEKGGVIDLMPRAGALLLSTRIAKFQMDTTEKAIAVAVQNLLRLPEVREREAALGLGQGFGRGGGSAVELHPVPRQPVPIHIKLQNVSLQEAFNKIATTSPKGAWIYRETDCNGTKTFTVEMDSGN